MLDVGTANALVLYKEALNNETTNKMNVAQFKSLLIKEFMKENKKPPPTRDPNKHEIDRIPGERRNQCTYCALTTPEGKEATRTRFRCGMHQCLLPLCSTNHSDCFFRAHEDEDIHQQCMEKFQSMLSRTKKKGKN